jgi:serine/threonine protein kinase/tetratricopeptide (TPR) repeat protein
VDTRPDSSSAFGGSRPLLPQAAPTGGTRLGPYTVQRELGRGGMGVVLEAIHDGGARVAIKVLTNAGGGSHGAKRFQREVQALTKLRHPHVVGFHDAGAGPPAWLAMEFVEGGDLDQRLRAGKLSYEESARIVAEVSEAIAYAHAQGTIHRDLKPANVLLRARDGAALVTDFGLARDLDASRFTQSGSMVGTLSYMAPEQARGEKALPPCDVWALGAILYVCLTGETPFAGESSLAMAAALDRGRFQRPRKLAPDVPPDLESVCLSCMRRDPNDRPTAHEVAEALRSRSPLLPLPAERSSVLPLLLFVVVVLFSVAGGLLWFKSSRSSKAQASPTQSPSPSATLQPSLAASPREVESPWKQRGELRWTLAQGPAPRLLEPALWQREGRPAPLAPAQDAARGAALPGFAGQAQALGGGKVQVSYPPQAWRLQATDPGSYFLEGTYGLDMTLEEAWDGGPPGASLRAANDMGHVLLDLGEGVWDHAQLRFELREVKAVDARQMGVSLGAAGEASSRRALSMAGRSGHLKASGSPQRVVFRPSPQWRELRFAPGAPAGSRVVLGGEVQERLEAGLLAPAGPGRARINVNEYHLALRGVQLSGVPLRVDRPALALCGEPGATQVGLALRWGAASDAGGPVIGLADAEGGAGYWLELAGDSLTLWRGKGRPSEGVLGRVRLSRAARSGEQGWLALSREGTVLRASAGLGQEQVSLMAVDPLPVPAWPLQACYGSSGPALECERAQVRVAPADPAQEAEERALLARESLGSSPREVWRQAALDLAQISLPSWAAERYVGPEARSARLARAREIADRLEQVAARLPGAASLDARARALLARVVSADGAGAERCATALLQSAGREDEGRAAFDRLWVDGAGEPRAIAAFVKGYLSIKDVPVREASLRAALILAPKQKAEILFALSVNAKHRQPRLDPKSPEGRAAIEGALDLLSRARLAGFKDTYDLDVVEADYLMQLGRLEDALVQWERVSRERNGWWSWQQRARCLEALGRTPEALEAALGCLAASRRRSSSHQLVARLVGKVSAQERPGLVAATLHTMGKVLGRDKLLQRAQKLAAQARGVRGEEGDLGAYVQACASGGSPPTSTRPTAVLARARAGGQQARANLPSRARERELVLTLIRLDPELDPLLR